MQTHFIPRKTSLLFTCIFIGAGILTSVGCQQKTKTLIRDPNNALKEINRLEIRINNLENQIGRKVPESKRNDLKTPTGPIKSVTLRLGTNDDRLRIYWANGSKSDLPCLKEQSIWACG